MRPLLPALLLPLVSFAACIDSNDIDGSGRLVDVQRDVGAFRAVEVSDGLNADIAVGPQNVRLHLDDNIVDHVRVEVRGDVLVLEAKEPNMGFDPSADAVIRVSSPTITSVAVRDGASARAEARGGEVVASCRDGAKLVLHGQDSRTIRASASDGSRIEITGAATTLDIDASDGSKIASEATTESVVIRSRDGSTVRAHASKSVQVHASDGSHVHIHGNPRSRDVTTTDGSSVEFSD